ncbi:hypothetical protein L6R50_04670 [Myxococcota bacterium]|nr:hypothetical protein [Myxococcota bacterium]
MRPSPIGPSLSVLLLALAATFPTACEPQRPDQDDDDDDATGDDDAADDDASDDDAADDDAADDDAADDDAADDDSVPAEDLHGGAYVVWYSGDYGVHVEGYMASAAFYDEVDPGDASGPDEIDPLEGEDDCGLWEQAAGGTAAELEYLSVGALTVRSGSQEVEIAPQTAAGTIYYTADLRALGYTPRFGEAYAFVAEGDDVPGFSVDPGPILPDAPQVSSPDMGYLQPLPRDGARFQWVGGGGGVTAIHVSASNPAGNMTWTITCTVADDGDFTVPEELMMELPAGQAAAVTMVRADNQFVDLGGSYWIVVGASSATYAQLMLE